VTVDVLLPTGAELGTYDGVIFTPSSIFTGSAVDAAAWLNSLAVKLPAGYDGNLDGSISVTFTDTPSGDVETNLANNSYTSTADFSVTITPGVETPTVTTDIDGQYLVIKEDGSGQYTVTASVANTTDQITQIAVADLPAGATIVGDDGGSYDDITGIYTVNGVVQSVVLTVTVAGAADSDIDLGTTTFTVTAADITSPTTTATNDTTATVVVDAVLDQYGAVAASMLSDVNESASAQTVNLGLSMTLATAEFTGSMDGGADTDGSETIAVNITINDGLQLSLASGAPAGSSLSFDGTKWVLAATSSANLVTAVSLVQVTVPAGYDGTISGTINSLAVDAGTSGIETDTTDNQQSDSASFTLNVIDGTPQTPSNISITVEEESIPKVGGGVIGNNETESPDLSYRVVDGDLIGATDFGPDGFGGIKSVTFNGITYDQVVDNKITITDSAWVLVVYADTGKYDFTMLKNLISDPSVAGEDIVTLPAFTIVAEDGDGSLTSPFTLTVGVMDDVPVNYTPQDQTIVNLAGGTITGSLNTAGKAGADGVDTVTFSNLVTSAGTITADGVTTLTSGGQLIYVYGFGTDTLIGTTDSDKTDGITDGTTVFTATLLPGTDSYTFDLIKPIDNGSGVDLTGLGFATSGNKAFNFIDVAGTTEDVLFSGYTINSNGTFNQIGTVNTAQGAFGVNNQSMNDGEVLGVDFVTSPSVTTSANNTYNYGAHYDINNFTFSIVQVGGGTGAGAIEVWLRAFDVNDDDPSGTSTSTHFNSLKPTLEQQDDITSITVNGVELDLDSLTDDGNGGYLVTGLNLNDQIVITTADGYSRLEIENAISSTDTTLNGESFDIGNFAYQTVNTGTPLELTLGTTLTDGDGDTSTGSISLMLEPSALNSEINGGLGNDTLLGGAGNDTIIGGLGNDILNGGAGDDILNGGPGDDILTGGSGKDTFLWNSGDTGADQVTDFMTGASGDVLDISDLLTDGLAMTADSVDGHLQLQFTDAGNNVVQTIDLNNIAVSDTLSATNLMNQLLSDGNIENGL
jgi:hypothetical protein